MTIFQQTALPLTFIWFLIVIVRFRRSIIVLIGGLLIVATYTLIAFIYGLVTPSDLGLSLPASWLGTSGFALLGLGLLLIYSPLADRLAAKFVITPPNLKAFAPIQDSIGKLIAGILAAWLLGGLLEELIVRGIVLLSVESLIALWFNKPGATGLAICIAALAAGLMHLYQGSRAAVIITQLSLLFGVLFVISGYNLWVVILCHGLYDTIAFIRFAGKKSKYANPECK